MCAGTEICNDPVHQMTTILLTNRCYPVKTGNLGVNIEHARQHGVGAGVFSCVVEVAWGCHAGSVSLDPVHRRAARGPLGVAPRDVRIR